MNWCVFLLISSNFLFKIIFIYCVCVEVRGQLEGVGSPLWLFGSQGRTQVVGLVMCIYPGSHLTKPLHKNF